MVLFFFPLAYSPICNSEACHFRDLSSEFARVGAQRVGVSTDTVDKQAHWAEQRSFDYPLLSDADCVVSEMFGVSRGRMARLRRSIASREAIRRGRHTRRRGLLSRMLPVRRTTFVIGTDLTVLKVVSHNLRAAVHADQALSFLQLHHDAQLQSQSKRAQLDERFPDPDASEAPSRVRPYSLTAGRTYSSVALALETPVEVLDTSMTPPSWPTSDPRSRILEMCTQRTSVAEISARLALPLGVTRVLVGDLVKQGYLRAHATLDESMELEERRELTRRVLVGLQAL